MSGQATAAAERFREVVLPHLADALAFARWLTGNTHDAEDVVQDACMKALAGIDGYAGGNPRAWLLAIVRNTTFTWLARNRPAGAVLVGDMSVYEDVPAGDMAGPEAALIAAAEAAQVEAAIAALPEVFREVVVLRDVNGLPYRDIAVILEVPVGTVMSRLSRGRGLLMAALREDAPPAAAPLAWRGGGRP